MGVVIVPLAFVGIHLLLAYWLGKNAPLRYALPALLGLTLLVSLAWYGLAWVSALGLGETLVLPQRRPLEWFRTLTQTRQLLFEPFELGFLTLPLPLALSLLGLGGLALARFRYGRVGLVVGLLLLVGGAGVYATQPMRLSDVIPQAQAVPLYPGAEQIMVDTLIGSRWRSVMFTTRTPPQEVLAFYTARLVPPEWQRDLQPKNYADLLFMKPYSEGVIRRTQVVTVLAVPAVAGANVVVGFGEWVNIKRLPLFPQAQNVQVRDTTGADEELARTTTFQTSANPETVITWYEELQRRDQSWPLGRERVLISDGLQLRLTDSAGPGRNAQILSTTNVEVLITARPQPTGLTAVTIQAHGPDLP